MIDHEMGPFAIVPLWLLDELVKVKTPEALRLYVALHRWTAGSDRSCHPSRQKLAATVGCSESTLDRYVKALVKVGALSVRRRRDQNGDWTSNLYTLHVVPRVASRVTTARTDEGGGVTGDATGGVIHDATGGVTGDEQTRPSLEPDPLEPDKRAPAARQRNPLFDATAVACGMDLSGMTRREARACGVAVAELAVAGATPEEVERRAANYPLLFPQTRLTPNALASHWSKLRAVAVPSSSGKPSLVERARARAAANRPTVIEAEAR